MPKFNFSELVTDKSEVFSTKLTPYGYTDADVGWPMKFSIADAFAKCADGDEIEGFLDSLADGKYDGLNFGGVSVPRFKQVTVYGAIAIGDYVVAETLGRVKRTATAVASLTHKWRYVSGAVTASGTGVSVGVVMKIV